MKIDGVFVSYKGGVSGGVEEAPSDGQEYVRKNATWSVNSGGSGVPEAPNDGQEYVRKYEAWAIATGQVEEAPEDTKKYGRLNASWVEIAEFVDAPDNANIYGRRGAAWDIISEFPEAPIDGAHYGRINGLWSALTNLPDAPSDGSEYVRLNGAWAINSGGSGVPEAPNDGKKYGRLSLAWSEIAEFVDAPSDGSEYVRKDGAWAVATGGGGGIPEAPEDGSVYGRRDASWDVISEFVDAPSNGSTYGRKDGAWAVVTGGSGVASGIITTTDLGLDENSTAAAVNLALVTEINSASNRTIKLTSNLAINSDTYLLNNAVRRIHFDGNGFSMTSADSDNFGFIKLDLTSRYDIDEYIVENFGYINRNPFRFDENLDARCKKFTIRNNHMDHGFRCLPCDYNTALLLAEGDNAYNIVTSGDYQIDKVIVEDNIVPSNSKVQMFASNGIPVRHATVQRNHIYNMRNSIFTINHRNDLNVDLTGGNLYRALGDRCDICLVKDNYIEWDGSYQSPDVGDYYCIFVQHEGRNTIVMNNTVEGIVTQESFPTLTYGQCTDNYIYKNNIVKNCIMTGTRQDDGLSQGYLFTSKIPCKNIQIENNFFGYDEEIYTNLSIIADDTVVFRFNSFEAASTRYPDIINNIYIRNNVIKAFKMGYYSGKRICENFVVEGNYVEMSESNNLGNIVGLRDPNMTGAEALFMLKDNVVNCTDNTKNLDFTIGCKADVGLVESGTSIRYVVDGNNLKLGADTPHIKWEGSDAGVEGIESVTITNNMIETWGNMKLGNSQYACPDDLSYDFIMTGNTFKVNTTDGYNAIINQITLTTGIFEIDNLYILPYATRLWTQRYQIFDKAQDKACTFQANFINKLHCTTEYTCGSYYNKKESLLEIDTSGGTMEVGVRDSGDALVSFDYNDFSANPSDQNNYNEVNTASPFFGMLAPTTHYHRMESSTSRLYLAMSSASHSELEVTGMKTVRMKVSGLIK